MQVRAEERLRKFVERVANTVARNADALQEEAEKLLKELDMPKSGAHPAPPPSNASSRR